MWISLQDKLAAGSLKIGNVYKLQHHAEQLALVYYNEGTAVWLPITSQIAKRSTYGKDCITVRVVPAGAPTNSTYIVYIAPLIKDKLTATIYSVNAHYVGKIYESDMKPIIDMLVKMPKRQGASPGSSRKASDVPETPAKASSSPAPSAVPDASVQTNPEVRPASHLMNTPIVNVQEVYELVKRYPGTLDSVCYSNRSVFRDCILVYKNDQEELAAISMNGDGVIESLSRKVSVDVRQFGALVMAFMNSRNASFEAYPAVGHGADRRGNWHLNPDMRYKVLHINPVAASGTRGHEPIARGNPYQPARLVRGHFTTYTPERPLFGKPWGAGTFWIGPHVAGNPDFGLVIKDYHIDLRDLNEIMSSRETERKQHGT